jgi:hypothetical protein
MAAVDDQHRAGHERECVRGEQEERPVEIGEAAEMALRNAFDQRLSGPALVEVVIDVGYESAGLLQARHRATCLPPLRRSGDVD